MELSQDEKDRIVAEEKLRYETVKELKKQEGGGGWGPHGKNCGCGCHGHGFGFGSPACHCGGFWKGLILGLVLSALAGFFFHHRHDGAYDGCCHYGASMMQNQQPSESPSK
jgi:hypothetical protein